MSGEKASTNLNTTTPGNFAFGYPGIVGAMMNTRFGEPFGKIHVVKGLRYQYSSGAEIR